MRSIGALFVGVLLSCVVAAARAGESCECARQQSLDALRRAELLVYGRIVDAQLRADGDVDFRLQVLSTLLGESHGEMTLTTAGPDACGFPVSLGSRWLFALERGRTELTRCQGVSVHRSSFDYLQDVVEMLSSDDPTLSRLLPRLERRWATLDRSQLRGFFGLARQLAPQEGVVTEAEGSWTYRRVRVQLTQDGTYERTEVVR